jgi:Ca2+-transporting ATPase
LPESWHALKTDEVLQELATSKAGLAEAEAQKRLGEVGPNELRKEKGKSPIRLFLRQFYDILIVILLIATGLSLAVGETIDAIIIFAITIASALLGFIEEFRSEKAVEALRKMTAPTALVLRDGKETRIPANRIVPGDLVFLYTGDKVPADARLLEAFNLNLDEASLTGESTPVSKNTAALVEGTPLNDRRNMVFTGTIVVYGRATVVVTSTGMGTEFGKIAKMVQTTSEETTPLEKRMTAVGKWIGILAILVCISVGIAGVLEGQNLISML